MRLSFLKPLVVAAGVAAAALAVSPAMAEEAVIAKVGDTETVTQKEFDKAIAMIRQRQAMQAQMTGSEPPEAFTAEQMKNILDSLIDNHVLFILAQKEGFALKDDEIDSKVAETKKNMPAGMSFEDALKSEGLTEADFRDMIARGGAIRAFTQAKMDEVQVTDADIEAQYEKSKTAGELDSVNVAHILVKVDDPSEDAWTTAKVEIDAAHKRVTDGEAFADVAKEVSDDPGSKDNGGAYDNVVRGVMVPEFESVAFGTEVGKVSAPFKTQFGWHFLTVTAKGQVSKEEASGKIREGLTGQKQMEHIEKVVADGKAALKIDILVTDLQVTPPAAPADGAAEEAI
ncbi:MAG: hypothetical protein AMXMBFR84_13190 [Candidatus Hydrogenedentota bacterium]